jgi:flagellar biosynthetic protein FliR
MRGELVFPTATLLGFLLTLARVSGIFIFVPFPGLQTGMNMARVVMSVAITFALFPYWPQVHAQGSAGQMAVWMVSEAALGIGIGLAVAFVVESLAMAAQVLGLQAGYAYASMIDPNTQADSGVLVVFAQLAAGLVFFAAGLDRDVLRIFAVSLQTVPAGSFTLVRGPAEHLLAAAQLMFSTGVRLALPVVAVLALVDISLALLGRVNAQLQMITLAFPIKMLLALVVFGWTLGALPLVMRSDLSIALAAAKGLVLR